MSKVNLVNYFDHRVNYDQVEQILFLNYQTALIKNVRFFRSVTLK